MMGRRSGRGGMIGGVMKGGGWIVKLRGKVSGAAYRLLGRLRHRPGRPGRAREGQGVSKEGTLGVPGSLWELWVL